MKTDVWIAVTGCAALGILFFILGVVFALLKEKGAMLISGFNTLPKEKQKLYDRARMSRDQKNMCFLWAAVFAAGGIASAFLSPYCAGIAFLIWLVLFFREVHLDAEKAFQKYKMQE